MSTTSFRVAIALLLAFAVACDNPAEPEPTPGPVAVHGIRVTPQSIQITGIGQTVQLLAVVVPTDATDRDLIWESTDSTVASVDGTGCVTGRRSGVGVLVTAYTHDGGFESSTTVAVVTEGDGS